MTFISKILTLNKLQILEKIAYGKFNGVPRIDYFNLGYPVADPPLLRGSMVLELHLSFLSNNDAYFEMGSPIDVGSIKSGFLKAFANNGEFIKLVTCDFEKFNKVVADLFSLPPAAIDFLLNHRICPAAENILKKYFQHEVLDFMYREMNPHAWLFEFALQPDYKLAIDHVRRLYIPNTYTSTKLLEKIIKKLPGKVVEYNPKYGIEGRDRRG
jgi:hypothetical protein